MTRKRVTKEEKKQREVKLREWYAALDANGDGVIDPFEYFTFALRQCLFHVEIEKEDELRSVMKENKASKDQSAFNILVFGDLTDKEGKTFVRRAQFAKLSKRLGFGVGHAHCRHARRVRVVLLLVRLLSSVPRPVHRWAGRVLISTADGVDAPSRFIAIHLPG